MPENARDPSDQFLQIWNIWSGVLPPHPTPIPMGRPPPPPTDGFPPATPVVVVVGFGEMATDPPPSCGGGVPRWSQRTTNPWEPYLWGGGEGARNPGTRTIGRATKPWDPRSYKIDVSIKHDKMFWYFEIRGGNQYSSQINEFRHFQFNQRNRHLEKHT